MPKNEAIGSLCIIKQGMVFKHNGHKVPLTGVCHPPLKGEWYLKPTGRKNEWVLLEADNDHTKHNYPIVRK